MKDVINTLTSPGAIIVIGVVVILSLGVLALKNIEQQENK